MPPGHGRETVMAVLARLLLSVACGLVLSIVFAVLFVPVYTLLLDWEHFCLRGINGGVNGCLRDIPMGALIFGPLFSIVGLVVGTPIIFAWFSARAK
ncbi:hypothetical protein PDE01_05000 [Paracoccus denitrificans]|nr:hypothetical protein PDE01_05000 [Paracoccus denitrificans]